VVVLPSTHIVDDVADLCTRMAIMGEGRILVEGVPAELTGRLDGHLWHRVVAADSAARLKDELPVVSTRLIAGRVELRVVAEEAPSEEFEPVAPTLEDVYFATLRRHGLMAEID